MDNYNVKFAIGLENLSQCKDVRKNVFIDEQKFYDEFDDIDDIAIHELILDAGKPISTARAFLKEKNSTIYKFGRICVIKEYRNKGMGKFLINNLENYVKKLGATEIYIGAQSRVKEFYEKLGYVSYGEEYLDEYCPHINMKKKL